MVNLVIGSLDGTVAPTSPDTLVVSAPSDRDGGQLVQRHGHRRQRRAEASTPATRGRSASPAPTARPGLPAQLHVHRGRRGLAHLHRHAQDRRHPDDHRDRHGDSAGAARPPAIAVSPAAASQFVLSGLSSTATAGVAQTLHRDREGPLRQRGDRLYRHRAVHQQRRRGDPAGQLHVHRGRQGRAHVHRHVRDGRLAVGDRHGHRRRASRPPSRGSASRRPRRSAWPRRRSRRRRST